MNRALRPDDALSEPVRALFAALQHADLETADAPSTGESECVGEAGREALGTRVRWRIRLRDGRPVLARYRAYGCPHTLAACEWVARRLQAAAGRDLDPGPWLDAAGSPADWAQALQIPAAKLGRLLVIEDALRCALVADRGVTNSE